MPPTFPSKPAGNPQKQPKRGNVSLILGVLTAGVFSLLLWQHLSQPAPVEKVAPPQPTLAAGVPLDTSTAAITVLTPATDVVAEGQVSITVLPSVTPAPEPVVQATHPLALLLPVVEQAYIAGGPNARRMATVGVQQAANTPASEAYTALRNATPENGPITPAVLLLETTRLITLPAPQVSATVTTDPANTSSETGLAAWLGSHLQRFVTLRHSTAQANTTTVDPWHATLGTVQQHIARNNAAEAALLLDQPPLMADNRLDVLRHLLAEYTDLQTRLDAVRTATLPLITGDAQ